MTTNQPSDSALDRMLRAHDVAEPDPAATRARLDARLAELPVNASASATSTVPPRRKGVRRVAWLAAAAAAATTAYLLLPGPGQGNAYATWTATPQALADRDRATAVEECRDAQSGPFWDRNGNGPEEFDPAAASVALAERRGDLVAVLLRDEGPMKDYSGFCVVSLKPGATSGEVESMGVAGSVGGPPSVAPADSFFEGSMSQSGEGDELISMVDGVAGADVVALTLHAGDLSVEATVENGRYAAWFPGRIFPDGELPPSGQGGPEPMITYDLTLADGTIIRDAQPSRP